MVHRKVVDELAAASSGGPPRRRWWCSTSRAGTQSGGTLVMRAKNRHSFPKVVEADLFATDLRLSAHDEVEVALGER